MGGRKRRRTGAGADGRTDGGSRNFVTGYFRLNGRLPRLACRSLALAVCLSLPEPLFPPIITGKLSVRGCDRRRRGREGAREGEEERESKLSKKLMRV